MQTESLQTHTPAPDRWQQVKTVALQRWELLNQDDLDAVRGNTERMITLLQNRYGFAREEAMRELAAWSKSLHGLAPSR